MSAARGNSVLPLTKKRRSSTKLSPRQSMTILFLSLVPFVSQHLSSIFREELTELTDAAKAFVAEFNPKWLVCISFPLLSLRSAGINRSIAFVCFADEEER
jgi:hypothetical protein